MIYCIIFGLEDISKTDIYKVRKTNIKNLERETEHTDRTVAYSGGGAENTLLGPLLLFLRARVQTV